MTKNKTCNLKNDFDINNMEIDLQSEVNDFKCKRSVLQPILEAISNSIQANSSNICVSIHCDKELFIIKNKIFDITKVDITDNGDGFTQENIERFVTLKKRTPEDKNKKGCKGMGRLSYLKFFHTIKYESITKDNKCVTFTFDYNFDEDKIKTENLQQEKQQKTTAQFFRTKKENEKYYTLQQVKQAILDELMIMLYFYNYTQNKEINIKLSVGYKEKDDKFIELETQNISKNDIPQFKDDISFDIKYKDGTHKFNLLYYIKDCKSGGFTKTSYCANEREVCEFFKSDDGFKLYKNDEKKIYLLLTSSYFDDNVNNSRDDFNIMPKRVDLIYPVNFEMIDDKLKQAISELFKKNDINTNNKIQKQIKEKHPFLAYYLINSQESNIVDNEKLIDYAYKQKEKDLRECWENFNNNKNNKQDNEEQKKLFNKVFSTTLAEYMALRQQKLKELGEMIKDKERNEAKIHDFIFPKGQVLSDNDEFEFLNNIHSNNLWLFDDRFMNYKYVFSDKKISEIKSKISDNTSTFEDGNKPDFAVIFDDKNKQRCISIELKPFNLNEEKIKKGFTQMIDYCVAFDESDTIKENWYYLITKIDERIEKWIEKLGYKKIVSSTGDIWMLYNEQGRFIVADIETLKNECEARHKLFFEILEKEVEMYGKNNNL